MTERHHYKYIVLDSSKENGNAVQAKFNVQVPHGITNASRVCVKSFSMPNVIHNVYASTTAGCSSPVYFAVRYRLKFWMTFASLALEMACTFVASNWTSEGLWCCAPAMPPWRRRR